MVGVGARGSCAFDREISRSWGLAGKDAGAGGSVVGTVTFAPAGGGSASRPFTPGGGRSRAFLCVLTGGGIPCSSQSFFCFFDSRSHSCTRSFFSGWRHGHSVPALHLFSMAHLHMPYVSHTTKTILCCHGEERGREVLLPFDQMLRVIGCRRCCSDKLWCLLSCEKFEEENACDLHVVVCQHRRHHMTRLTLKSHRTSFILLSGAATVVASSRKLRSRIGAD